MAGTGEVTARPGWYADSSVPDTARYWDGTTWTEHRAPKSSVSGPAPISWVWRVGILSVVPWLAFEAALLLVPLWVSDESYGASRVLLTAVPAFLFVGTPGLLFALVTTRRAVLAGAGIVLTATAILAAIAIVSSDDAQAGLAILWIWCAAVPLFLVTVTVEWWLRHRLIARRALP